MATSTLAVTPTVTGAPTSLDPGACGTASLEEIAVLMEANLDQLYPYPVSLTGSGTTVPADGQCGYRLDVSRIDDPRIAVLPLAPVLQLRPLSGVASPDVECWVASSDTCASLTPLGGETVPDQLALRDPDGLRSRIAQRIGAPDPGPSPGPTTSVETPPSPVDADRRTGVPIGTGSIDFLPPTIGN